MPDPLALIAAYRARGVLLDANLLVLYVAGSHDRRLVLRLKTTRGFSEADLELVAALVAEFDRLVTTPHVLTEVNGLLNVGGLGRLRHEVLGTFAERIDETAEVYHPAGAIAADPAFRRLGLTDAAALALAADGPLVISADLDLCVAPESRGLGVINDHRIRPL